MTNCNHAKIYLNRKEGRCYCGKCEKVMPDAVTALFKEQRRLDDYCRHLMGVQSGYVKKVNNFLEQIDELNAFNEFYKTGKISVNFEQKGKADG